MIGSASRRGFVLITVLVLTAVTGIIVGSVMAYVSYASRMTRVYAARSRCRFAAQSALEYAKARIQKGFESYVGGGDVSAVKIDPRQARVYDWFDSVSGDRRTIGITDATHTAITIDEGLPTTINACRVVVAIGRSVQHPAGEPYAAVPLVATALYVHPDGLETTSTIWERVVFGTGQSPVFDYAYFVNNYGWMNGSNITINGDLRANGDVSLSKSTINGFVYAAANDEVDASGLVGLSSPRIYNNSGYRRSSATSASRYDVSDFSEPGSYDGPAATDTIRRPTYDANGNVVSGTVAEQSGKPIVNDNATISDNIQSLPMPFVSKLENYVSYAQEKGGTLSYNGVSYKDAAGKSHLQSAGTVNAHYSGSGPSGDATGPDKGALVLVGTQQRPIVINGPVVVDSDVLIKGYVSGQGTIYSGRNIHIVGDIKYLNAPTYTHGTTETAAEAEVAANVNKDMLGLVAKGNVVVGNCTSTSWQNSLTPYINGGNSSVVERYACDPSDADIGYGTMFGGNYMAVEATGEKRKMRTVTRKLSTYTTQPVYDRYGRLTGTKRVYDTETCLEERADRRYYETCCDDTLLNALAETGVARIDAIIYNNHGLFGTLGRTSTMCQFNGSAVCRDEALIMTVGNGLVFNWDQRLRRRSGNKVTGAVSLPVGPQDPYVLEWQEVPDEMNPGLARLKGDGS